MNKLLDNLLTIHEKLSNIVDFVNIKVNVEALDQNASAYKEMVKNTDLLLGVLTAFSERIHKI